MIQADVNSFCERCGTRVGAPPPEAKPLAGLVDFVLGRASARPDSGLRLCLGCRNYICPACLNEAEGVCQTCAPLPVAAMAESTIVAPPVAEPADALAEPVVAAEPVVLEVVAAEPEPVVAAEPVATAEQADEEAGPVHAHDWLFVTPLELGDDEQSAAGELAAELEPMAEAEAEPDPVAAPEPEAPAEPEPPAPPPSAPPRTVIRRLGRLERVGPPARLRPAARVPELRIPQSRPLPPAAPLAPRFTPPAARPSAPAPTPFTPLRDQPAAALPSPFLAARAQPAAPLPVVDGLRACLTCQLPLSARASFCRRCGSSQPQVA